MPIRTLDQIARDAERLAGRGLLAGGTFLATRIKEVLSVPAPRRRVIAGPRSRVRPPGTPYWVATTRATPGAPPRKLSGRLRASVMVKQPSPERVQVGVFNLVYARPLETWMNHPYLWNTFISERDRLGRIIGSEFGSRRVV